MPDRLAKPEGLTPVLTGAMVLGRRDQVRGLFAAGAVGDALGTAVQPLSWADIQDLMSPEDISDMSLAGAISDETQLTMFTAAGLLNARLAGYANHSNPPARVHRSDARWLVTQGHKLTRWEGEWTRQQPSGWLSGIKELHAQRSPDPVTLAAIDSGLLGDIDRPVNDECGYGAVLRAAPVGIYSGGVDAFSAGAEIGALTHGHPSGFLAAGALAEIIAQTFWMSRTLTEAVEATQQRLTQHLGHEEVKKKLQAALTMAELGPHEPTPEVVETIGDGWTAAEAVAIGVYAALKATSVESGILAAVKHSGNSATTGAIAGHIVGAAYGEHSIPDLWLEHLELRATIQNLADDWVTIHGAVTGAHSLLTEYWWTRYPDW